MEISSINPARVKIERPEPSAAKDDKAKEKSRETIEVPQKKTVAITRAEVDSSVNDANDIGQLLKRKLNFTVDDTTDRLVVKIVDEESGDIVRQVPAKEMLKIAAHLKELSEMNNQVMSAVKSVILDLEY